MPDLALVTGISGYLGGHVALTLLNSGYAVRGSLRDMARADAVRSALSAAGADVTRLEFIPLNLLEESGWEAAMRGVRYLHHVASPFVIRQPRDRQELIRPAVEGTRRAVRTALAAGVERIVLTSSIAAIVYGHPRQRAPFTPADWTNPDAPHVSAYAESKLRAEREAWSVVESFGCPERLAVLNPAAIFGPLIDSDPGTSAALLLRLFKGSVPAAPRLTFSIVDVRDVAEAHLAAMRSPTAGGQRHILSEREMSILEIARTLASAYPERAGKLPKFEVPDLLVRLAGLFDRQIGDNAAEIGNRRAVDGSSGRHLLDHPYHPAPDTLAATAESLIRLGLV